MSEQKKQSRKPSGFIGSIVMKPDEKSAEFQAIEFPTRKDELERYIVNFVMSGLRQTGTNFYSLSADPVQNPEDDLDFTLPTRTGKEYLELMEVAALEHVGGSYDAGASSYNHGELADYVYSKVVGKAQRYAALDVPVHLLLYTTDWRFRLAPEVLALLGYWLQQRTHPFKTVLYFVPDDATHGEAKILCPVDPKTWATFDEQALRNGRSFLADPTQLRVNPDGSVDMPLGQPRGT